MDRPCDVCGTVYTARRSTSRYCSSGCRVIATRKGVAVSRAVEPVADKAVGIPISGVEMATLAELQAAGRVDSAAGQKALTLARLIDTPPPMTHSSIAGWSREHGAAMAVALKDARPVASKSRLELVREARNAKRGA